MGDIPRSVVIVGATSAIAAEVAAVFAAAGARLLLVGRDPAKLAALKQRLGEGDTVTTYCADGANPQAHAAIMNEARRRLGDFDAVLIAFGFMPIDAGPYLDSDVIADTMRVNLTAVAQLLSPLSRHFEARRGGCIAVISSIAGDRGKARNLAYAAAKAGLSAYLSGLRNHLHPFGVRVITIKPGNTQTPMAAGHAVRGRSASAARVGAEIAQSMQHNKSIVYTPFYWSIVMRLVRLVPEALFKRMHW